MKSYSIFILSFFFLACSSKKQDEKKEIIAVKENSIQLTATQAKNIGITTTTAITQNIATVLKVNGKIDVPPQNLVSISMPLGGFLKSTKLLPGMHFSKGDVIAVMEDQQYIQLQQDYLLAKAKINFLKNDYQRQKELNATKTVSDKILQQAEVDYNSQKILLNSLAQKLQLIHINPDAINENNITRTINIYAPIDGFVTKVNVNIGKYIAPTDVMFELVNPNDIHLNLVVFEKDVPSLFVGEKVKAFTNHQPQKKYNCEIILIGKDINANGSTDVHCHFETYDKSLIPGTYMNAEIEGSVANVLTVPQEAIVEFEGKKYVYIKRGENKFTLTEIEVGASENGFTEIKNTAAIAHNLIVTKGAYGLLMAMKNGEEE